jgi:phage terminase large subunit-like protein
LLGGLVLEDGRSWGEAATSSQWEDATAILDPGSRPYHFLTRARGYSKTTDLAGVALVAMLEQLPPGARLYGLASDLDQGRLLADSLAGFITRTENLRGAFEVGAYKVTTTRGGTVLEILAADAPSAYGLRPSFLIVDEITQWGATPGPRRLWEAASSAMAKIEGARMVLLSSAGDPAHWSKKILDHARRDALWRVHEIRGPAPWTDPARLEEQRRRLPESSFRRLFLNEWAAAEDRLARPEDLAACVTLDGPLAPRSGLSYRIGVDVGLRKDRTVVAVCHAERIEGQTARRLVLDRMHVLSGSREKEIRLSDVEEVIFQASREFNHAPVRLDPWQSIGLKQRLTSRSVSVEEFNFSAVSVGRLASSLHIAIRDRLLAIPDDPELIDELSNVRLRETSPGVLRMDHDADQHDDRAIALALCVEWFLQRGRSQGSVGSAAGFQMDRLGRTLPPVAGRRPGRAVRFQTDDPSFEQERSYVDRSVR